MSKKNTTEMDSEIHGIDLWLPQESWRIDKIDEGDRETNFQL